MTNGKKVDFLNVIVKIKNGRLSIDLFFSKPVESHQYLYYESYHTKHIKKSITYSQTFILKKISTSNFSVWNLFFTTPNKYCMRIQTSWETNHEIKANIFICF